MERSTRPDIKRRRPAPDPPAHRAAPTAVPIPGPTTGQINGPVDRRPGGRADLLALQRTVGNRVVQRLLRPPVAPIAAIQRANPADNRLPADQPEALALAQQAKTDIDAALTGLAADADPQRRNTPDLVAQQQLVPRALTPRHDSPVGAPQIHFFPGQNDYTGSFTADPETTHRVGSQRKSVWIRARQHDDVDAALASSEIADRLVAAVSEIAFTKAARPGSPNAFDRYRARFNGLYVVTPFASESDEFDPSLDSKGPRTPRARAVFDRIYADESAVKTAYDANTGGIREKIDAYTVPDGLNQLSSPRLQALRAAFFPFSVPVSNARYPAFKGAIEGAAAGLDADDREAVDLSNDWQRLINAHVTTDVKRAEIRAIISGQPTGPTPTPTPTPSGALTLADFLASWDAQVSADTGGGATLVTTGDTVTYVGGTLLVRAGATLTGGKTNSGLALFVRGQVLRGSAVAAPAKSQLFPARGDSASVQLFVQAPAPVPAGGDPLAVRVEILSADQTTVLDTKDTAISVAADVPFTQAQAEAEAAADLAHFLDPSPAGIVGQLMAMGSQEQRLAEAMTKGVVNVQPMTMRHDSAAFVAAVRGAPDPSLIGYFSGTTYGPAPDTARSFTSEVNVAGMTPDFLKILVKRTFNVPAGAAGKNADADIIRFLVHEAVHAFDSQFWQSAGHPIDSYKTEFRAYWMDGGFGPPDQATCPTPPDTCRSAEVDPTMPAPGPKSPRARAIFEHLYDDYDFVKPAYDNNADGFRDKVDAYVVPDGINLVVSVRLERLRKLIANFNGANFAAFRAKVQAFTGIGPPPPDGVLTPEERAQVSGNRAWRDLVNQHVPGSGQRATIKTDLGIPL